MDLRLDLGELLFHFCPGGNGGLAAQALNRDGRSHRALLQIVQQRQATEQAVGKRAVKDIPSPGGIDSLNRIAGKVGQTTGQVTIEQSPLAQSDDSMLLVDASI